MQPPPTHSYTMNSWFALCSAKSGNVSAEWTVAQAWELGNALKGSRFLHGARCRLSSGDKTTSSARHPGVTIAVKYLQTLGTQFTRYTDWSNPYTESETCRHDSRLRLWWCGKPWQIAVDRETQIFHKKLGFIESIFFSLNTKCLDIKNTWDFIRYVLLGIGMRCILCILKALCVKDLAAYTGKEAYCKQG